MRAIVVEHAGPPEVLEIRDVPRPEPRAGWVLIQGQSFRTQPLRTVYTPGLFT